MFLIKEMSLRVGILLATLMHSSVTSYLINNPYSISVRIWHSDASLTKLPTARSYIIPKEPLVGVKDFRRHVEILEKSLEKLTKCGIYDRMGLSPSDGYDKICQNDRFVLISHGTEADPIYNFGNLACLQAFVRSWEELCKTPSRESVVYRSVNEVLRESLMKKVTEDGFVEGVTGIRVTGNGKFVRIVDGVVWNCYDEKEKYYGQAAFFDKELAEQMDEC